jgi:hypothetical protein
VQSCSKEIEAGAALENCRRLINQIKTWLSATTRRQLSLTARLRALCSSSQAVDASNVVYLALYRRRLCRHLRRRSPSPTYGEAAITGKHAALEAISASLRDVTSLRDFIVAEVGAITASPC